MKSEHQGSRPTRKAPKLEPPLQASNQQNAREGNADLIRGVGLFDTPEPGTGKAFMGCPFPGNGALVVYAGSELCFDTGALEISVDDGMQFRFRARPRVAAIELNEEEVRFHPPAFDPLRRAVARVCEQFTIDARDPMALMKLISAMVTKHYPDAFLSCRTPANERRASDVDRLGGRPGAAGRRAVAGGDPTSTAQTPRLPAYRESVADGTLKRLFREGQALLRQQDMDPWRRRAQGRPRKNSTPKQS